MISPTDEAGCSNSSSRTVRQGIELKLAKEFKPFESLNSFNIKRISNLLERKDEMLKQCNQYITFNQLSEYWGNKRDMDVIMLGIYECTGGKCFLKDLLEETDRKVELDVSNITEYPKIGDFIEVWGKIRTKAPSAFIEVYFYTNWECDQDLANKYARKMEKINVYPMFANCQQ